MQHSPFLWFIGNDDQSSYMDSDLWCLFCTQLIKRLLMLWTSCDPTCQCPKRGKCGEKRFRQCTQILGHLLERHTKLTNIISGLTIVWVCEMACNLLKIPKRFSESVTRKRTDNTMANTKKDKKTNNGRQNTIQKWTKTISLKTRVNSSDTEE